MVFLGNRAQIVAVLLLTISTRLVLSQESSSSSIGRKKRADDGNPLEAVVAQLSQKVSMLTAQIAELQLKTSKTVAFYAWNTVQPLQATAKGTLIFNHASLNIGNAYDIQSGYFTAPYTGVYCFHATFMTHDSNRYTHAALYVDNTKLSEAISHQSNTYDHASFSVVAHVNAGQRVHLVNIDNTVSEYFDEAELPYTTFGGFLVRAD